MKDNSGSSLTSGLKITIDEEDCGTVLDLSNEVDGVIEVKCRLRGCAIKLENTNSVAQFEM